MLPTLGRLLSNLGQRLPDFHAKKRRSASLYVGSHEARKKKGKGRPEVLDLGLQKALNQSNSWSVVWGCKPLVLVEGQRETTPLNPKPPGSKPPTGVGGGLAHSKPAACAIGQGNRPPALASASARAVRQSLPAAGLELVSG